MDTSCGRFDTVFDMTAFFGGGSHGGGVVFFSTPHSKQHQPPLFASDLKLEIVNVLLHMMENWVHRGGAVMCTTHSDKHLDLAWQFIDP